MTTLIWVAQPPARWLEPWPAGEVLAASRRAGATRDNSHLAPLSMGMFVASWKAHVFPLFVVIPALIVGFIGGAQLLGIRWTPTNTLIVWLLIVTGIVLECLASWKIANMRFAEPAKTRIGGKPRKPEVDDIHLRANR
jgi:hypothetical protein